jgi:hypothetical protein
MTLYHSQVLSDLRRCLEQAADLSAEQLAADRVPSMRAFHAGSVAGAATAGLFAAEAGKDGKILAA